jgi:hypothetical protein
LHPDDRQVRRGPDQAHPHSLRSSRPAQTPGRRCSSRPKPEPAASTGEG